MDQVLVGLGEVEEHGESSELSEKLSMEEEVAAEHLWQKKDPLGVGDVGVAQLLRQPPGHGCCAGGRSFWSRVMPAVSTMRMASSTGMFNRCRQRSGRYSV